MNKEKLTIEQGLKRLQEITAALEAGTLTLEESLKLYEEGVTLTASCHALLEEAAFKIKTLSEPEEASGE